MLKVVSSLVAVVAIGTGLVITYVLHKVPEKPNFDLERWWGIGPKPKQEDVAIRLFNVDFNETIIQDLKQRVRNRRPLTRPLEGIQSEYGMNTVYLEKILDYWVEKYDFKGRAALLNRFPHYKTRVQGLDIHFIRVKPNAKGRKVLPLLMLHGWPSSSKEFDKVIPILTTPRDGYDFVYEVIAADLPGFGFSEGTNKQGLSPVQIGIIMRNLMRRLGFENFYVQAGDWGSQCATHMATLFPDEVLGHLTFVETTNTGQKYGHLFLARAPIVVASLANSVFANLFREAPGSDEFHTNMPISSRPISTLKMFAGALFPTLFVDPKYVNRIYPLRNLFSYVIRESGYFHIQATKPDTIGVALTDSPTGLASYIIEKMAICSNRDQLNTPHGGIENLNLDDVLDTITILWTNNCIVTASRIYAEGFRHPEVIIVHNIPTPVPTAIINFRYEVLYQPDWMVKDKFPKLIRSTTLDVGGHFAALHTPQMLADDVYAAGADFLKFYEKQSARKKKQ